jgi:thioesterase domain-containing protein
MRLASYRRPELSRLLETIRANIQASRHYVPGVYPGDVTFFQSDTGPGDLNLIARWRQLAAGGVSVYTIRGHHLDMLRQPHVADLAKRLEACLDQTQPDSAFDS